jgi:hypothetical protein
MLWKQKASCKKQLAKFLAMEPFMGSGKETVGIVLA